MKSTKVPVRDRWESSYSTATFSGGSPPSRTSMMQGVDTGRAKLRVDRVQWLRRGDIRPRIFGGASAKRDDVKCAERRARRKGETTARQQRKMRRAA